MTDDRMTPEERIAAHRARMNVAGAVPMTAEEILTGQSQGGVPRPAFLKDHDDDGTVDAIDPGER
ncbi:hypothetical protein [Sphingomonas sp. Leaf23]|uniref:hypothetical protein n=1 Tax=Sphingomonas sp. Leaf23 TaxID=1735689 RepID=UPI000B2BD045|nr:hypothetical protein [Sphingomonas sp. Leaf23]